MQDILMLQQSIVLDAPGKHCKRQTAEKTSDVNTITALRMPARQICCRRHGELHSRITKVTLRLR